MKKLTVLLLAAVLVFSGTGCRQSPAFERYFASTETAETASVRIVTDLPESGFKTETDAAASDLSEEKFLEGSDKSAETKEELPENIENPDDSAKNSAEPSKDELEPEEASEDDTPPEESLPAESSSEDAAEAVEQSENTIESDEPAFNGDTRTTGEEASKEEGGSDTDGETPAAGTDATDGTSENGDGDEGDGSPADIEGDGLPGEPYGIIAQGQAAVLVQMLGGANILSGVDGTTLSAMSAYFPYSELSSTVSLGSGNTLDASLVSAMEVQPALCFLDTSYSAIPDLGIECIILDFSSVDGILTSVERVRTILNSGYADGMAQSYNAFYGDICSRVSGCGAARTVYISEWDSGAGLCIGNDGEWFAEISGLAVADRCAGTPLNRLLQIANVDNCVLNAGGTRNWYVNSFLTEGYTVNWWDSTRFDMQLGDGSAVTLVNGLGGTDYPAVIAANSFVKASIENAAASGGNVWTVSTPEGLITDGGAIASVITGAYSVYVNPQGLGSWTNGSPECILESLWVGWRIQGICAETDVMQEIKDFYQIFYRCALTGGQLAQILAGY